MKTSLKSQRLTGFSIVAATALCLGLTAGTASADNYSFNNATGGSGTWENGSSGTPWKDTTSGTSNLPWDNTVSNSATFQGIGGTVDVEGPINALSLAFSATSDETLNGTGVISLIPVVSSATTVINDTSNNNVTIDNDLQLDDTVSSDRFNISNSGTGTLTLNGNISYVGSTTRSSGQALIFITKSGSNTVFNGDLSGTAINPARLVVSGGTLTLTGDYTGTNPTNFLELDSGTAVLGTSKTGTGVISMFGGGTATTLLTSGAQNITNQVNLENIVNLVSVGYEIVGGSTADISTFSGGLQMIQSGVELTAVSGGRVDITGAITTSSTNGLVKIGAGTVNLSTANTYKLAAYQNTPQGTLAADIQQGILLISNTSGSAFGTNSGTVQVEANAMLGGTGNILPGGTNNQKVVAMAGTSIIAPGDAGQANLGLLPTIGTLHLQGGLTTTDNDGLTLDFKLDGALNDAIDMASGELTLNGPITVNLTSLGTVETGIVYTLISGSGTWDGAPTFAFNTPDGYTLDSAYGTGGYIYDATNDSFSIEFATVPEPSTYGLMGLGLLTLAGIRRFRRLSA